MEKEREITLTNLPLNKFKDGQHLTVRFLTNGGMDIHCFVEFIKIERGLVKVKIIDIQSPDWFRDMDLIEKYPDHIGRFRASSCYVWGKGPEERWPRCYWFKDTKTSAT